MIGFSQFSFFLLSLISRPIRAIQTAFRGHSGLPGLGDLDCPLRDRKKSLIGGIFLLNSRGLLLNLVSFIFKSAVLTAREILDINDCGLAQALALALDEPEALQLPHEGGGPVVPATEELLHILLDEIDEYPAQAVQPAVFDGQPYPVQHQAVKGGRLQGELAAEEGLGDPVKTKLRCLVSVKVIQIELHSIPPKCKKAPATVVAEADRFMTCNSLALRWW